LSNVFVCNDALLEGNQQFFHAHGGSIPLANAWESAEVDGSVTVDAGQAHLVLEGDSRGSVWVVLPAVDFYGEEPSVKVAVLADD
jgi:hypothetical protein